MKISFDWDSTLSEERTKRLALKFISEGHDVWITTSRLNEVPINRDWSNDIIFKTAAKLGIPIDNIQFTNGEDKYKFLAGFDMHFDDDQIEIELIEENLTDCIGVLILDP